MQKKSSLMRRVEREQGRTLEELIPSLVNQHGLSGAADVLQVSKSTLGYWLLKLGLRMERVVVAPGQRATAVREQPDP
jgi:hypothetical protein